LQVPILQNIGGQQWIGGNKLKTSYKKFGGAKAPSYIYV